jgi:spermidine/putrescine transport system substrate-binding protein
MMVPINAPNPYTAMVFMNYTQFPEVAAQNAEWVGYATPNQASKDFIDPEMLENESVYPTAEVSARLQWIEDVGNAYELYDRIWTEFKAAAGS